MSSRNARLMELVVIVAAVLAPLFIMAGRIDSDEWEKAAVVGAVASVMAVYREWRTKQAVNNSSSGPGEE